MNKIGESELIINSDGSIFHLKLKPEHIAKDIILVGDPGRVAMVSDFFDKVDLVFSKQLLQNEVPLKQFSLRAALTDPLRDFKKLDGAKKKDKKKKKKK